MSAEIDEKGNYEAVVPAGEVKVSVDNRELEPRDTRGGGMPVGLPPEVLKKINAEKKDPTPPKPKENAPANGPNRYVTIPNKYYDTETSGLGFKVERGGQKHDLELTK